MHERTSMGAFDVAVSQWMVAPVHALHATDRLSHATQAMAELGVSAMPVLDDDGRAVGVLSRSDLVDAGRGGDRPRDGEPRALLSLPGGMVAERMTPMVATASPETKLSEVARHMVREQIHRIYVVTDQRLSGVVSTKEAMAALVQARIDLPLAEIAHPPLTIDGSERLSLALDRMADAHRRAILVIERGWPIGFLTQDDLLTCREVGAEHPAREWMDPRILCLPLSTPAFQAAHQALGTRMRRVIAIDGEGIRGVASGMDFTRVVAFI